MDARQLRWKTLEALRASEKGRLRYHTHWRPGEVRVRPRRGGWKHLGHRFARCGSAPPVGGGGGPVARRSERGPGGEVSIPCLGDGSWGFGWLNRPGGVSAARSSARQRCSPPGRAGPGSSVPD